MHPVLINNTPHPAPIMKESEWQPITEDAPKLGDVVWLYEKDRGMWIGGREMIDCESWLWGNAYGEEWHNGTKWDADIHTDDDYKPTHWQSLPEPPKQ